MISDVIVNFNYIWQFSLILASRGVRVMWNEECH